ncbi:MAG: kelch repeat-containing protein [Planctomycetota bacterium]
MTVRTHSRIASAILCLAAFASVATAQPQGNLTSKVLGTTVGPTGQIEVSGDPGDVYVIFVSLNQGPSVIGGKTLDVGLELLPLTGSLPGFIGTLNGSGQAVVPYFLPGSLPVGATLYSQAATLITANKLDDISEQSVLVLSAADSFTATKGNLGTARAQATATLLDDCRVLLTGGGSGNLTSPSALISAESYDFFSQTFGSLGNMTRQRAFHTATKLNDGRVLLVGGNNSSGVVTATSEIFDPTNDSFTNAAAMSRARAGHTASKLNNGNVVIAGGTNSFATIDAIVTGSTNTTEIYNGTSFSSGPNMSEPRFGHNAVTLNDGRTLVSGGLSFITIIIPIPLISSDAEVLNVAGSSFSGAGNMGTERVLHAATVLANGNVLVTGGGSGSVLSPTPVASCEIYQVSGNSWSSTGSMAGARAFHQTFRLASGEVFVAGGADGSITAPTVQTTVELYNPSSGTWSPSASSMITARGAYSAVVLPDGSILYAGGGDASGLPTATAERYTD